MKNERLVDIELYETRGCARSKRGLSRFFIIELFL
jgi:hypothetical protein